jgi:purine nucleosidase
MNAVSDISVPSDMKTPPVKIIFDTDMSGDCDDVGALAVLNKLADFGECELLACVINDKDKNKAIAAAIDVINTYYGRPNIPIGTYQGPGYDADSKYTAGLRDEFPHTAKPDDQMPKAVDVYRKTLAAQPDGSVKIVSVGMLINLRNLLESGPDAASPLKGADLVKKKVKQLVVMGGAYPSGSEWNFSGFNSGPDTKYVVENWTSPILFSGFEIGAAIGTSKKLSIAPANNPVRRAYELFNGLAGRQSWDLTAALAAVRPTYLYWDVSPVGSCVVTPDGKNTWSTTPRDQTYLLVKTPPSDIAAILDDLITIPPRAVH